MGLPAEEDDSHDFRSNDEGNEQQDDRKKESPDRTEAVTHKEDFGRIHRASTARST
jgi:hypothetical protein